jgi:capsular polysaccharide export protein
MAVAAMSYYLAGAMLRPYFWNYEHHKSFSVIFNAYLWCKSGAMKILYTSKDTQLSHRLAGELSKRYFLVPLQVHNDAQVTFHSHYSEIQDFIREVVVSFAKHAPSDTLLVIKHHPMDRGSKHYGEFINRLTKEHNISERIICTHQIHLPTALDNARGVIVINSTVGLSALLHNAPVITLGNAIYDIPGLTCQQPLENFWGNPGQASLPLFKAYRAYVISTTQLNGSFYGLAHSSHSSTRINRP